MNIFTPLTFVENCVYLVAFCIQTVSEHYALCRSMSRHPTTSRSIQNRYLAARVGNSETSSSRQKDAMFYPWGQWRQVRLSSQLKNVACACIRLFEAWKRNWISCTYLKQHVWLWLKDVVVMMKLVLEYVDDVKWVCLDCCVSMASQIFV